MNSRQPRLERVGVDGTSGREVFAAGVGRPDDASEVVARDLPLSGCFVALIACDAEACSEAELVGLAHRLLEAGCVYFCCWGPGCERVHDVIDHVRSGNASLSGDASVMTTWHGNEELEEVAEFAVRLAIPDDRFIDECRSVVALSIGNRAWQQRLKAALEGLI